MKWNEKVETVVGECTRQLVLYTISNAERVKLQMRKRAKHFRSRISPIKDFN